MVRRVLIVCLSAIALGACRLDVNVDMTVAPDGTGTLSVVATADADVVAAVPTIAEELATDDIVAAGWVIDGPTPTPDGGLSITLTHDFVSDEEATNLLNSLGPPFNQMSLVRNTTGDDTTIASEWPVGPLERVRHLRRRGPDRSGRLPSVRRTRSQPAVPHRRHR